MPNVLVVLPTYNERKNLSQLVLRLLAIEHELGVLIVDDASPDRTGDIADELVRAHPERVSVIHRPGKLGLGTAYVTGFRRAMEGEVVYVVTMDADWSHNPEQLPGLLASSQAGADLAIGSRYVSGGDTPDFPLRRRVLSRSANLAAQTIGGLKARDATSGYRCYKIDLLRALPLDSIRSEGYSFLVELLFHAEKGGFKIAEVPIVFSDREHGISKISREEIGRAVVTVLRLGLRRIALRFGAAADKKVDVS